MGIRKAQQKFVKFAPGLTIAAGRPFSHNFQQELVSIQQALNKELEKYNMPVFWYNPAWFHMTITAITRSFESKPKFFPLELSDLTEDGIYNKLYDSTRDNLSIKPTSLISLINKHIKKWHEIKKVSKVPIEVKKPYLFTNGHIALKIKSDSLKELGISFKNVYFLKSVSVRLHITLGFVSSSPDMDVSVLKTGELDTPVSGIETVSDILVAHYQSRSLATLHGGVRFPLDGSPVNELEYKRLGIR